MSEDTFKSPTEALNELPAVLSEEKTGLFDDSEHLGEGESPQAQLRAEELAFAVVVGAKLRKARKAAGYTESAAALALSHKGVTQISLFENGRRPISLPNLRLLADLYGVTTDWLLDRHDDILACPQESNQAVLKGVVVATLSHDFSTFVSAMAQRNALILEGLGKDRVLLRNTAALAEELVSALEVFQRHAKDFEGMRGGAKLGRLIGELHGSMGECLKRQRLEEAMADHELQVPAPERIREQVQQMMLSL
ncbi:helix-turn-helix transcriptional regulator [Pseudomonas sp. PNPG3]|uniref:helix-turn-helix domain-containing protein n=1 Tax=Pseudomonas sp. PNPG3 TaxID=2919497 RepID=UPI001FFDCF65|nr:helix-turn-helix transcriptional regulator [Pseudomonas sp. PNPG3]MCK2122078.1 helix-turn-helix domain-containing protein [Pseudomonas sp. PNPG3]